MSQLATLKQRIEEYNANRKISPEYQRVFDDTAAFLARENITPGLSIGEKAPDFTLKDKDGIDRQLSDYLAKGPVVITFFRGDWCPFCNLELRAFQDSFMEIKAAGGSLLAIGPQLPENATKLTEQFELAFDVLSDPTQETICEYKLQYDVPDDLRNFFVKELMLDISEQNADGTWKLPVPATYVLDDEGVVRARNMPLDPSVRMEPSDALEAVTTLAYFKAIFLNAPMAITVLDKEGTIIDFNPAARRLFGDLVGLSAVNRFLQIPEGGLAPGVCLLSNTDSDAEGPASLIADVLAKRKQQAEMKHVTLIPISPEVDNPHPGSIVNFSVGPLILGGNLVGAICVFDDVTQNVLQSLKLEQTLEHLKMTQARLIQSEKMAGMGQLIAGIAHEIKNPLNFVNNFAEVSVDLAEELDEALQANQASLPAGSLEEIRELLGDLGKSAGAIHGHGQRANEIVKSMMELVRGGGGAARTTDLNQLVQQVLEVIQESKNETLPNVQIVENLALDLDPVEIVPQSISRVLVNLLNNAFEALEEAQADTASVSITTRRLDNEILIEISDSGPGIPSEDLKRVFDPFFTTKPPGSGHIGFGLSLSYDIIVGEHRGDLVAANTEDGAMFTITIPVK